MTNLVQLFKYSLIRYMYKPSRVKIILQLYLHLNIHNYKQIDNNILTVNKPVPDNYYLWYNCVHGQPKLDTNNTEIHVTN